MMEDIIILWWRLSLFFIFSLFSIDNASLSLCHPSKECVRCCVQFTQNLELIKELLGFFLVANDETRKNVNCLIKEAIISTIKMKDESLVIGFLEFLQTDKKIKTLTDTYELTEDGVFAATVEQSSGKSGRDKSWVSSYFTIMKQISSLLFSSGLSVTRLKRNDEYPIWIILKF